MGISLPILLSAGMFIRMAGTLIGTAVRFDRNPGSTPEWLGNVIIAIYIAAVICLTLAYLLSYFHLSACRTLNWLISGSNLALSDLDLVISFGFNSEKELLVANA
ncbi:hypothetical protein CK203_036648 [Vitis vinifera]|uniref:Uncharacterized protein n=1 Tax=Vitis vinifera TaxID=29760 RepID=A0A438HIM3_VITVI|nr:hypothetical protein CK203_080574 [Vitis vinifera]RVW84323.1 hypothetical protein CK203_036648 [Vitis vinifera]